MIFQTPYFIVLIIAILTTPYLNFGDFGAQILMFIVAICIPNSKHNLMKNKDLKILCSIFVFVAAYSLILFLIGRLDFKYLSRGISSSIFRIIEVFFCYKLVRYYGAKSFYYLFYGLLCAYSINILLALFTYGFSGVFAAFFSIFSMGIEGGSNDTDEILESCHAVLLIMPFLAAYFLSDFLKRRSMHSLEIFAIATIVSLLAFKRIAIAAAVVIFCIMLLRRLYNKITLILAGSISVAVGLGYIFIISTGIIYIFSAQYGINMMTRDRIWKALDDLYVFAPNFWGNGWGVATKYLSENNERLLGIPIGGLHNDLLKVYIDLGFWGFIIYFLFFLIFIPFYYKNKRFETSFMFFLCQLYLFMMYFTDNSQIYFACQAVAYIMPFTLVNSSKHYRKMLLEISIYQIIKSKLSEVNCFSSHKV